MRNAKSCARAIRPKQRPALSDLALICGHGPPAGRTHRRVGIVHLAIRGMRVESARRMRRMGPVAKEVSCHESGTEEAVPKDRDVTHILIG